MVHRAENIYAFYGKDLRPGGSLKPFASFDPGFETSIYGRLSAWSDPASPLLDTLVMGSKVFRTKECPDMTYGRAGRCLPCPDTLLSVSGSASCSFRPGGHMVLILCLALTICGAALCSGKALERKLKSGGLWWCWGFAFAFALLPIAAGPVDGRYGPTWLSSLLAAVALPAFAVERFQW